MKGSPSTSFVSAASAVSHKSVAKEKGIDYWLEVYCGKTRSYVSVHCISGEVGADADIERSATQPLHYVVAFGEKSSLKDVTPKYATEWLTVNRKLQVSNSHFKLGFKVKLSVFCEPAYTVRQINCRRKYSGT